MDVSILQHLLAHRLAMDRWTDGQIGQQVSSSSRTRELTKMKNEQFLRARKKSIIPLSYLSSMFE